MQEQIMELQKSHPIILVDGVFFQLYQTGIARVWRSLFEEWSNSIFREHIIVLDRMGTAPKFPGIKYITLPQYDYHDIDTDRELLQQVCDGEDADLFISSYYTTPTRTPSVFMAYDMIPEMLGWNLESPMWQEKNHAIQNALTYISISENTSRDLVKCFPNISPKSVTVAKCGVNHKIFSPLSQEEINHFRKRYGINKPYFILVGAGSGYKNSILFFQAFSQLTSSGGFDIVITGSGGLLLPEFRDHTSGSTVYMLQLSDEELAIAYSGALALIYPSKYEGFGMPIIEAMACGCPVITCPNGSIPEAAGDAAIYIKDDDVNGMADAICEVQKPSIRTSLITNGLAQSKQFSWAKMAQIVSSALLDATLLSLNLQEINLIIFPDWTQPEEVISLNVEQVIKALANYSRREQTTLLIYVNNIATEDAELFLSSIMMNLLIEENLEITNSLVISLVADLADIQLEVLLPKIRARIILAQEDQKILQRIPLEKIPSCQLDSLIDLD
jgi:glycosyltransferase involved in cell wall biosynthesis